MGLYDGAYKILRMTGSTYEVESIGADFVSINCGGNFYKSTCNRLHGVRELEHSRIVSELYNQNGVIDAAKALPVATGHPFFYFNLGATQDPRATLIGNTH